jgi:stage IV sporulation protein FB
MRHNAAMLLSEPQHTSADLNFSIAGIRVRVSAWFWAAAALLGWQQCQWWARGDQRAMLQLLVIWITTVFVSILVHELGHAFAYRTFGQAAHVVLYHFGGLAVPELWGRRGHLRPVQRLLVSAAGPLAQLFLAAMLIAMLRAGGYAVPFPFPAVGSSLGLDTGRDFPSLVSFAIVDFLLFVNICWPLLNLLPVPPLDGGQIVREGLLAAGVADAHRIAGIIGVCAGGAVAWWGYTNGQPFLGIMFAMLAASCYQSLSAGNPPWRRWN